MVTSTAGPVEFDPRIVKSRGGTIAALIALLWAGTATYAASYGDAIHFDFLRVFWLLAIGAFAAVPIFWILGRAFADEAIQGRHYMIPMVAGTVLGTALLIALAFGLFLGAASILTGDGSIANAIAAATATTLTFTLVAFIVGIIFFGIPGVIVATTSTWIWNRWLRRDLRMDA